MVARDVTQIGGAARVIGQRAGLTGLVAREQMLSGCRCLRLARGRLFHTPVTPLYTYARLVLEAEFIAVLILKFTKYKIKVV